MIISFYVKKDMLYLFFFLFAIGTGVNFLKPGAKHF